LDISSLVFVASHRIKEKKLDLLCHNVIAAFALLPSDGIQYLEPNPLPTKARPNCIHATLIMRWASRILSRREADKCDFERRDCEL